MKICSKCGCENEEEAKYCVQCGSNLEQQPIIINTSHSRPSATSKKIWVGIGLAVVILLITLNRMGYIGEDKTTYLIASQKQVVFLKSGGAEKIDIDTDGRRWEITHTPDWCTVEKDGTHINITCTKDSSAEDRQGWITIVSGKYNLQIEVGQYGHATYLKLSTDKLNILRDGQTVNVQIETDGDSLLYDCPDYCSIALHEKYLTFSFESNPDFARAGTITIQVDNQQQSIAVYQAGKCPQCNGAGEINCPNCYGYRSIVVGYDMYGNQQRQTCPYCNGSGKDQCPDCKGTGVY